MIEIIDIFSQISFNDNRDLQFIAINKELGKAVYRRKGDGSFLICELFNDSPATLINTSHLSFLKVNSNQDLLLFLNKKEKIVVMDLREEKLKTINTKIVRLLDGLYDSAKETYFFFSDFNVFIINEEGTLKKSIGQGNKPEYIIQKKNGFYIITKHKVFNYDNEAVELASFSIGSVIGSALAENDDIYLVEDDKNKPKMSLLSKDSLIKINFDFESELMDYNVLTDVIKFFDLKTQEKEDMIVFYKNLGQDEQDERVALTVFNPKKKQSKSFILDNQVLYDDRIIVDHMYIGLKGNLKLVGYSLPPDDYCPDNIRMSYMEKNNPADSINYYTVFNESEVIDFINFKKGLNQPFRNNLLSQVTSDNHKQFYWGEKLGKCKDMEETFKHFWRGLFLESIEHNNCQFFISMIQFKNNEDYALKELEKLLNCIVKPTFDLLVKSWKENKETLDHLTCFKNLVDVMDCIVFRKEEEARKNKKRESQHEYLALEKDIWDYFLNERKKFSNYRDIVTITDFSLKSDIDFDKLSNKNDSSMLIEENIKDKRSILEILIKDIKRPITKETFLDYCKVSDCPKKLLDILLYILLSQKKIDLNNNSFDETKSQLLSQGSILQIKKELYVSDIYIENIVSWVMLDQLDNLSNTFNKSGMNHWLTILRKTLFLFNSKMTSEDVKCTVVDILSKLNCNSELMFFKIDEHFLSDSNVTFKAVKLLVDRNFVLEAFGCLDTFNYKADKKIPFMDFVSYIKEKNKMQSLLALMTSPEETRDLEEFLDEEKNKEDKFVNMVRQKQYKQAYDHYNLNEAELQSDNCKLFYKILSMKLDENLKLNNPDLLINKTIINDDFASIHESNRKPRRPFN